MTEFVALKGKAYAQKTIGKKLEDKRCKGTKKCVIVKSLTFDDYTTCLFVGETNYRE